jgi:hypothetical protein
MLAHEAIARRLFRRAPGILRSPSSRALETEAVVLSRATRRWRRTRGPSAASGDHGHGAAGVAAAGAGVDAGGSATHGFGFACCGGLSVTSRRHDAREANPRSLRSQWYRMRGIFGRGTSAASRVMKALGVMTRWVRPLRAVVIAYAMRPSRSSSIRASAKGGLVQSRTRRSRRGSSTAVVGPDAHGSVDVEAVAPRREASLSPSVNGAQDARKFGEDRGSPSDLFTT